MLGCRYIFVSVMTFALAFLPVFCPYTNAISTFPAHAQTASACVRHFKPLAILHHCNQCPCKSAPSVCHQHFLRAMPAAPPSLTLVQSRHLVSRAYDCLSIKTCHSGASSCLSRNLHAVDLSTHTLLHQHCALIV